MFRRPVGVLLVAFVLAYFGLSRVADSAQTVVGTLAGGTVPTLAVYTIAASTDIGVGGQTFVVGNANVASVLALNGTTLPAFLQIHDSAAPPIAGTAPTWVNAVSTAANSTVSLTPVSGQTIHVNNGLTVAWSTTQWTYTAPVANVADIARVAYHL
jgi:hypothetical protein